MTYHCFYRSKKLQIEAETSYAAQQEAARQFKAKKAYEVTVVLVAVDGKQVSLSPDF